MKRLNIISSALALTVFCSGQAVNAEVVAGQLVANPSAIVSANGLNQKVGSQATSYMEGDVVSTNSDSSAKLTLSSGLANIVVAPNSAMSVKDASRNLYVLEMGAFGVDAKTGEVVTVETESGVFKLSSTTSVDAIVRIEDGSFAAISNNGSFSVESQDGAITLVDSGKAFVFNDNVATSVDVQAAGGDVHEHQKDSGEFYSHAHDEGLLDHSHASGYFTVNNALIVGGLVAATALLSGTFSDGGSGSADADVASPAE